MEIPKERRIEQKYFATMLREYIGKISEDINDEMEEKHGVKNFLEPNGRINMKSYAERNFENPEMLQQDEDEVFAREVDFSMANDSDVKEHYKTKFKVESKEEIVENWKNESEKKLSIQLEPLSMGLFHKYFGDKYYAVRATLFDDYSNGVDMFLVDRKTGEIICAMDELSDRPEGHQAKDKISKIMKQGGTTLKYGFQAKKDENKKESLEEKEFSHLPIFCVSVMESELRELKEVINLNDDSSSDLEINLLSGILEKMSDQSRKMKTQFEKDQKGKWLRLEEAKKYSRKLEEEALEKELGELDNLESNLNRAITSIEYMRLLFRKRTHRNQ